MDHRQQNQFASREDVDLIKTQLNQIVEAMMALLKRENNFQQTVVIENVIPPLVNNQTQPQHVRIPFKNPTIQEYLIVRDGHSSPHNTIEYHSFAFLDPNSQGAISVRKIKDPLLVKTAEKHHMLEERLKAI